MLTLFKTLHDKHEKNKANEHDVELFKATEDTTIAFEPPKESFNFIAAFVEMSIVVPPEKPIFSR